MLNRPVTVGVLEEDVHDFLATGQGAVQNPFPGLRPFSVDECHLFFGREGQVDEILLKLSKNRCITVMGYSGSGKSSLMNCGLVPVLVGGFMTNTSPHWTVIATRPGTTPIANLTTAVVGHLLEAGKIDPKDVPVHRAIISSVLRRGPDGLIEVCKYLQTREGENVFILIDQFEEIFRYKETGDIEFANEAAAYVNLVLTAVHQKDTPAYFAINMRSDFIGDCASFQGLTTMINESNYLVPQMTREQKRMAIEGPISVGGGRITPRLMKRLLSDIGDNQDQLPIMQHALMRTWDYWVANREAGEWIDIRHYNAIGKIGQALSLHANEAYDELSPREKEVAEVLFKSITEKNLENQGLRRACKVKLVAELAEAGEQEVINVIEEFRKPGRSFLMPGLHVKLSGESVVELSHESLMRIWTRLSSWVEEEFESAQMYTRLSDAAAMYQIGKTGLWRPPDLQLALNWHKKQKPTRTWAQRYDEAFERAIVFLDTSRITYEAELKNQEMLQRRMLRRARVTSIILGVFLVVAIAMFFYGLIRQFQAEENAVIARSAERQAVVAKNEADSQRALAEQKTRETERALKRSDSLLRQLNVALAEATAAKLLAEKNFRIAEDQRRIAERETTIANEQREIAKEQHQRAERALVEANRLLYLSIAQSMEAKSRNIEDKELAGLLAMQGYLFHTKYEGAKYDPYVFNGLYYAITKQQGLSYNAVTVQNSPRNRMFGLAVSQKSNRFFTTGNDGRIIEGDIGTLTAEKVIAANAFPNRALALSADEQYLVNASDSTFVQIFDLVNGTSRKMFGHRLFVNDVKFLPDNSGFISASADKTIRRTDHLTGLSRQLLSLPYELKSISISHDGRTLVGVSAKGQVALVDLVANKYETILDERPNRVLSAAFNPVRNIIAFGVEVLGIRDQVIGGLVKVYDLETKRIKELAGHKSGISDLEFSPDGLLLASAGLDKKLQMWVVDKVEDLPITMDNNNGNIWNVGFTRDSDYLIATCNSGEVRIWPTDPRALADMVCPGLTRNFTPEEWSLYVGRGLPFETTCKSLLIKEF
jgi:energy-coupling factor transporter ATP-binding protein EcfA2